MEQMSQLLMGTKVRFYDSETPWNRENSLVYAREDIANFPQDLVGRLNFSIIDNGHLMIAIDRNVSLDSMRRHVLHEYLFFSGHNPSEAEEKTEEILSESRKYEELIGAIDVLLQNAGTEYSKRTSANYVH